MGQTEMYEVITGQLTREHKVYAVLLNHSWRLIFLVPSINIGYDTEIVIRKAVYTKPVGTLASLR